MPEMLSKRCFQITCSLTFSQALNCHRTRMSCHLLVWCCGLALLPAMVHPMFAKRLVSDDRSVAPVSADLVFEEEDGLLAVEAEHFFRQDKKQVRAWHLHSSVSESKIVPDGDPVHLEGASGGAYLEALPDTRRTHGDKLIGGENFSNEPGKMAIVHYKIWINHPGRYYVWVRTYSTGTEDNGLHVGLDGQWPESGRRLQWTAKHKWFWDSKQRTTKVHTGVPGKIFLDIKNKGEHVISFSMREDGFEFDKWLLTSDQKFARPAGTGPVSQLKRGQRPKPFPPLKAVPKSRSGNDAKADARQPDGDGQIEISGELKTWHTVTLTQDGPFANESDESPNPFRDYRVIATFEHEEGSRYRVPGYFAADGDAGNSSASSGTKWRVHFTPDQVGTWRYSLKFERGRNAAIDPKVEGQALQFKKPQTGSFKVLPTDKAGRDLRGHGRLRYVGKRYLQFAGSKEYFLKAGADAPETLLGYRDFDGTVARKKNVPLKSFSAHVRDWQEGDPTWKKGQGKGLIGAINYLSGKGCNAFSFLTYNAGGDGDNVWPHLTRSDKLHFDVSKLAQWEAVFDHATRCGMYLHFKLQETENDDNRKKGSQGNVPMALDGGDLGVQRKLYLKELVARFGHHLALNWNLGEENTQSTNQQKAMASFIRDLDPYDNLIVVHTYPGQQDQVYRPLLGQRSVLRGASLQNSHIKDTHWQTLKWVNESKKAGVPWVVAFDESGSAAHGQCPDLGYRGFDGKDSSGKYIYTQHEVRRQTLWGTLMAGGAGVEYYFGYKFVENDLNCEDWRSRDQSWDYCRIALNFFREHEIPFWEMENHNRLVGNEKNDNSVYCLARPRQIYVVYLANGKQKVQLSLDSVEGEFQEYWVNPKTGDKSNVSTVSLDGKDRQLNPPASSKDDWLYILRKK